MHAHDRPAVWDLLCLLRLCPLYSPAALLQPIPIFFKISQAAQVRKSAFVEGSNDGKQTYHPETHHSCTIYAGTMVQQVVSVLHVKHSSSLGGGYTQASRHASLVVCMPAHHLCHIDSHCFCLRNG